jgi:hypothetical protein
MKNSVLARLTPIAAALSLAALVTGPAHAADSVLVSSTATLSNLTYQLIDLDPTDGITPWAKFSIGGFIGAGNIDTDTGYLSASGLGPNQTLITALPDGSASASAGPNQLQVYTSIRTSDVLPFNSANIDYYTYQPYVAKAGSSSAGGGYDPDTGAALPSVTLSANTLLVIKGSASLQQTTDFTSLQAALAASGSGADYLTVDANSNTSITAHLLSITNTPEGSNANGSDLNLYAPYSYAYGTIHATPQDGDVSLTSSFESGLSPFKLTLANTDTTSLDADLTATIATSSSLRVTAVYPYTQPPQPAVPEPSTYVLTGLGLLAAGAVARKRSSLGR